MKKIDLEQILKDAHHDPLTGLDANLNKFLVLNAMKDACKQMLDIVADNAEIEEHEEVDGEIEISVYSGGHIRAENYVKVNKDSILKLKELL